MELVKDINSVLLLCDYFTKKFPHSRWFLPSEFFKSETADKLGIINFPDDMQVIDNLVNILEHILIPVRKRINMPIFISSGYRCPRLNQAVGGVSNSYHTFGRAVDIYCANNKALDAAIVDVNNANLKAHKPVLKEFIRYKNFIHIAL